MSQKNVKKDIEYYKKQFRKQQDKNIEDFNMLTNRITWHKTMILAMVKKSKLGKIILSPKDFNEIKEEDVLEHYEDSLKNVVFQVKE